jgi:hypothetical protein
VNDKGDTAQFSTWCPKAIARIGQPKRTILSRSIPIRLERKAKGVKTEKLKSAHADDLEDLRRKISRLANDIRAQMRCSGRTPTGSAIARVTIGSRSSQSLQQPVKTA